MIHAEVTPELKPKLSKRKPTNDRHSYKEEDTTDSEVIDESSDKDHIFINQMHNIMQKSSTEDYFKSPINNDEDER